MRIFLVAALSLITLQLIAGNSPPKQAPADVLKDASVFGVPGLTRCAPLEAVREIAKEKQAAETFRNSLKKPGQWEDYGP